MNDPASYRNRGGWWKKLVTAWKGFSHNIKYGEGTIFNLKSKFSLTPGAVIRFSANCTVLDYAYFHLTKPKSKVLIGRDVVIGRHTMITAKNIICVGNDTIIGDYVQIIDHSHGIEGTGVIRNQEVKIGEVIIGSGCWIGAGAKILKNVHIGNGAVIGANAVVTGNIPDYAIAVGAPARVVKYRTDLSSLQPSSG